MRKSCLRYFILLAGLGFISPVFSDEIKRRVLIIPFDNVQANRNYNWMADSMAENLKTELLKSNRFQIMDVTLLRKIDPSQQFTNLTAVQATDLARKLNCEGAIIGRYVITRKGGKENALIQAEGVDALIKKTIVIKSEFADIDGAIFDTVQRLSAEISQEFTEKLPALSAKDAARNERLEKLIARLENPPKGFIDTLVISEDPKGTTPIKIKPEFDIDTFDYEVFLPFKSNSQQEIYFDYTFWGQLRKVDLRTKGLNCSGNKCTIEQNQAELAIAREKKADSLAYKIHVNSENETKSIFNTYLSSGLPLNLLSSYISVPAGVRFEYSRNLFFRWLYPYVTADFYYMKPKTIDVFYTYYSGGGFSYPIKIGRNFTLMPIASFGVTGGYFQFGNNTNFLEPAFDAGVAGMFRLGQKWHIAISSTYRQFIDKYYTMSMVTFQLGAGFRF